MKKVILIAGIVFALAACNNNNEGANSNEDPNKVQPVSEALPDSTKLVNDSVIMPDTVPNNGKPGTHDDSSRKNNK
ncbi:MAG: membrane lipoprotein lipid attachment site-containing protein [Segetibacter sp.]